jgi:5-methylcytosine-specific restriction endonuclease McrA
VIEKINRKEAKARGLKFYYTGEICKHGHIEKRRVDNGSCLQCMSQYYARNVTQERKRRADYCIKNEEEVRRYNANYYAQNLQRIQSNQAEYYRKNAKEICERISSYRVENANEVRQREANYRAKNPESFAAKQRRRRARKRGAEGTHTKDDVQRIFEAQSDSCAVCFKGLLWGSKNRRLAWHVDHKIPLAKRGSDWPENLQILCYKCNISKGAKTMEEWLSETWEEDVKAGKFHYLKCEAVTLDDQ